MLNPEAPNVNTLRSNVNPDETPIAGAKTVFIVTSNDAGSTAGPTGNITISGIRPESTDAAKLVALNNTMISTGSDGGTARTAPGNITITADTLSLSNDTGIFTTAFSDGGTPAGNITLNVNTLRANTKPDGTLITGTPQVFIDSVSLSGQAGNITISGVGPQTTDAAKQLALNNIEINTVLFGGAAQTAQTVPATITVTADTIHLTHSKNIKTDTQGAAPAGNIVVTANTFLADDASKISSSSSASGPGGNISITAGQSVTLNSGSSITASSTGPGNAGHITITAGNTFASNAATVSSTATQATGGDIAITAGQSVTLTNGASVSASSTGAGNAGNININSGQSFAATNSSVTTQAAAASGGTITISTTPSGMVQLTNSMISASVLDGTGGGGSVDIDPQFVILQNSQILAQAVQGPGGNISIATNLLLPDANSVISASSQFGVNGNITIQSPNAPASGKIQPLGKSPLLATSLLNQRCAALAGGELSSFTVAGRDSLPAEPTSWLASPLALGPAGFSAGTVPEGGDHARVIDPVHETALLSLRQIAPAGFLTQAFAVDWSAGCKS
jgi:large exoprotein involved in heme utilization and adhesion